MNSAGSSRPAMLKNGSVEHCDRLPAANTATISRWAILIISSIPLNLSAE